MRYKMFISAYHFEYQHDLKLFSYSIWDEVLIGVLLLDNILAK